MLLISPQTAPVWTRGPTMLVTTCEVEPSNLTVLRRLLEGR
ncbi:hypothetical protein HNR08_001333 [Cellulomonas hominis]|nr:hypothetical protein [Cellulomonas hominis]MBB5472597.1 hypothetical protein [Cellulomonas hominis]